MRLLICSKRDLTSLITLNELLPHLGRHRVRLLLASRTRATEHQVPELTRMKFFDRDLPFDTFFPALDTGQPADSRWTTFEGLERRFGVPSTVTTSLRAPETLAFIRGFQPDLILSVRFSFIFREAVRAIPRLGIVNVHPGRLPSYAGLYPHMRAMMAGDERMYVSLHQIDAGIDTGPILMEDSVQIDPRRSAYCHQLDLHLLGNRLVRMLLDRLEAGEAPVARLQASEGRAYASYPTAEDFQRFRDMGMSLIDLRAYGGLLRGFAPFRSAVHRDPAAVRLAATA